MPLLKTKTKRSRSKSKQKRNALSTKEKVVQKRKRREQRNKLFKILSIGIFLGLSIGLPLAFVASPKIGAVVTIAIPAMIWSFAYPRTSLWFFLIYMPFSGTVTYWIGSGNALFQLGKDIFYLPALVALVMSIKSRNRPIIVKKKLLPTLILLVVCLLITLFLVNGSQEFLPYCNQLDDPFLRDASGQILVDPNTGIVVSIPCKDEGSFPFLQGLLGLKVLIGYVPLIFCAYYLIDTKEKLVFLGRLLLVLAIVCCVLGIFQYMLLSSGACAGTRTAVGGDLYKASIEAKCFVGGAVLYSPDLGQIRLPGTFVSPWHWAWFLIANSAITFIVAFSDTAWFWRVAGLAGMALVFINSVICGQRIALALVPFIVLTLSILTGQIANFKKFIPFAVVLSLILVAFAFAKPEFIQQRVDSFVQRWNTAPPQEFILSQFDYAITYQKGLFGRGIGKATNSARIFGPVSLVETYHAKLLFEIGYAGFAAFMIFLTHLLFLGFKDYIGVKDPNLRSYAAGFWVFMLIITYFPYWYPLDTDPVGVYYWLFAGIIFRLPSLYEQQKKEQKEPQLASSTQTTKKSRFKRKVRPQYGS